MDLTPIEKMEALADVGYKYPSPWPEYRMCVQFLIGIAHSKEWPANLSDSAKRLLKEIGEWNK